MTIKVKGTTVINDSKDLINIRNISASGKVEGNIIATQEQAEKGTNNQKIMTPVRVKQAIQAIGGTVIKSIQRGTVDFNAYWIYESDGDRPGTGAIRLAGYSDVRDVVITQVDMNKAVLIQACQGERDMYSTDARWPSNDDWKVFSTWTGSAILSLNSNGTRLLLDVQGDSNAQTDQMRMLLNAAPRIVNEPVLQNRGKIDWQLIEYL